MNIVEIYSVEIIGDDPAPDTLDEFMAELGENLADLLPPGYEVRVLRWDDGPPEDDDERTCGDA